jgi:hypothetical protein
MVNDAQYLLKKILINELKMLGYCIGSSRRRKKLFMFFISVVTYEHDPKACGKRLVRCDEKICYHGILVVFASLRQKFSSVASNL